MPRIPPLQSAALLLLLGGAAFTHGASTWPLVAFPMYSYMDPANPRSLQLEGIAESGQTTSLVSDSYFRPYLRQDIAFRFSRITPADRPAYLEFVARVYESGRLAGRHQGPRLARLRLLLIDLASRETRVLAESGPR